MSDFRQRWDLQSPFDDPPKHDHNRPYMELNISLHDRTVPPWVLVRLSAVCEELNRISRGLTQGPGSIHVTETKTENPVREL